jgi:ubiquinol-cytochrome c reductase cytochrome b subunit
VKDTFGLGVFLIFFSAVVFFAPEMGGYFLEKPNFEPANPLQTPEHIAPVWYFTAFYSILRAIPDKFGGVLAMGMAIFLLFVLPWLDRGKVRSIRYRGLGHRIALGLFAVAFICLSYLGLQPPSDVYLGLTVTLWAQIWTAVYFGFFVFLWAYTYFGFEKTKPIPDRVNYQQH